MKPYDEVSHDRLLSVYVDVLEEIGFTTVACYEKSDHLSMPIICCCNNSRLLFLHLDCLSIKKLNQVVMKLRKELCSDHNDKSRVALLATTYRFVFMLGDLNLSFHKCKIIFDLFCFPVIELIKEILNLRNVSKVPIGDWILHANCELIVDK